MNELFEMCFELEDIISIEETGYRNMYDITVSGEQTFLLGNGVVSHNSAIGGLVPVLGRKECGYFELRGKPLNAYSAAQSKFTANKELSELYKIIKNECKVEEYPDGQWFEIEYDGQKFIVNENDIITLDGQVFEVQNLL